MQKIKAFGTWLRTSKNGFFTLAVFGYWLKCYLIYLTKFTLGATGPMQGFLLLINPIPSGMLILGLGMLMKGRKSYWTMLVLDFLLATWLFATSFTTGNSPTSSLSPCCRIRAALRRIWAKALPASSRAATF